MDTTFNFLDSIMDPILNFWDSLQKSAAIVIVQKLGTVDWILIFAVLAGMAWGSRKGVGGVFGKVVELLLVAILVMTLTPKLSTLLTTAVPAMTETIANPISFVLLSIFLWIGVAWCFNVVGKLIKVEISGSFKAFGGLIFGAIYFFLLFSFITQFLLLIPVDNIHQAYHKRHSYTGDIIARTVPNIQQFTVRPFLKKTEGLKKPLTN